MDIYSLLNKRFICPFCKKQHWIPTKEVVSKKGAILLLPFLLSRLIKKKRILILSDNITYRIAAEKCEKILKEKFKVSSLILFPQGGKRVYAEEKYLPAIVKRLRNKDAILIVGTGSITDMGKYAAHQLRIPVISVPTAPSMNGFTSSVAAFLSKGLKLTLPVKPALGVLTDIDLVSNAPLDLIRAGFADSLAKSFANSDWKISSFITGEDFCPLPLKITTAAEKRYINKGEELIKRDRKVISRLMEGLTSGGFSMVIAGKSSPSSGGEHLLSHFLDVEAHQQGREPFSYHGLQVGLGIIVSSHIYQRLKNFSAKDVEKALSHRDIDYEQAIKFLGRDASLIKKEFKKKIPILKELPQKLPPLWEQIKEEVFPLVYPPRKIKEYLRKAKCPLRFEEIGVNKELAYRTIMYARYVRGRLTILDIADELGTLKEIAESFIK